MAKTTGWELLKEEEIYRKALWEIAQERFHVEVRPEKRDVRGFALTVAKTGKLGPEIRPTAGGAHTFKVQAHSTLLANNVGMAELAKWLMLPAASPGEIKDETSLSGRYDFTLRWCPLRAEQVKDPNVLESPIIFDALREQLGLRLKAAKVPQDFYTVLHAQSPDAN